MAGKRVTCGSLLMSKNILKIRSIHSSRGLQGRLYPTDDELYTKTSVNLVSKDPSNASVPHITKFGPRGFTISGDQIVGPVAIIPWSLLHWNVGSVDDVNKASLSLFHLLEPRIEIVVLGLGDYQVRLNPEIHKFMREKGIALEVQSTAHACASFNYLVSEGRIVAAGLIPPTR